MGALQRDFLLESRKETQNQDAVNSLMILANQGSMASDSDGGDLSPSDSFVRDSSPSDNESSRPSSSRKRRRLKSGNRVDEERRGGIRAGEERRADVSADREGGGENTASQDPRPTTAEPQSNSIAIQNLISPL